MFLVDRYNGKFWYKVIQPAKGQRINVESSSQLFILVRTVINGEISHYDIQQSDYIFEWDNFTSTNNIHFSELADHHVCYIENAYSLKPAISNYAILREAIYNKFIDFPFIGRFTKKLQNKSVDYSNINHEQAGMQVIELKSLLGNKKI